MRSVVRQLAANGYWMVIAMTPVFAQTDRMGGPAEFRSPDRPIPTPALKSVDPAAFDSSKSLTIGPPAADEVMKDIDRELGQTGTRSIAGSGSSSLSPSESSNRRDGDRTTFK